MAVDIYIGALVEHGSERAVLSRVVQVLRCQNRSAVILANINLGGRQIDLLVALERLTLVIEAKGNSGPVRGGENGTWQYRAASGGWKDFPSANPNPHDQTVRACHAVRDAMTTHACAEVAYPSAALVFAPTIPFGSEVGNGTFKAAILGLDAIERQLQRTDATEWTLVQWRAFAETHRLIKVAELEAAFDPHIAAAERILADYVAAFDRAYRPLAHDLVAFPCCVSGHNIPSDDVVARGAQGANLLLRGPSGCGKTLLAYCIGLDCSRQQRVPILVQAKDFLGNLRALANQEVALLDMASIEKLVEACRRLNRPLVLVIDGYNECSESLRVRLTRSVAAATRRFLASVVVTAQGPLDRSDLLDLTDIHVPEPDITTKRAIAAKASATAAIDPSFGSLINSVGSGLEARLIGEVGRELSTEASRFALFDGFVRKRLGTQAGAGIRALARIAGLLLDRISFGLSVRDLDRIAEQEQITPGLLHSLQDTKLLVTRGDRASFGHELYLNAFSAEAIVRRAHGNADAIAAALRLPQNADRKALILGAIDDRNLLLDLLHRVTDVHVIQSCLSGQCGHAARLWVEARYREVLRRAHDEIAQVNFELGNGGIMNVQANAFSLFAWTPQDRVVLQALPQLVTEPGHLDEILALAAALDRRLAQEFTRLRDRAREQKVPLRSGLFANSYVWGGGNAPAAASVFVPIHSGVSCAIPAPAWPPSSTRA